MDVSEQMNTKLGTIEFAFVVNGEDAFRKRLVTTDIGYNKLMDGPKVSYFGSSTKLTAAMRDRLIQELQNMEITDLCSKTRFHYFGQHVGLLKLSISRTPRPIN